MKKTDFISSIETYVKEKCSVDSSGHDWWHVRRVRNIALTIAQKENADIFIVEASALLHDVCDHKLCNNIHACLENIHVFLTEIAIETQKIESILLIIQNVSYKGANVAEIDLSLEGKIVQDADRLDAIGAIGIARAFAYGGSRNRIMYDPELKPVFHQSFEEYKKSQNTTINHFYEKLLLLKNRLHMNEAKKLADERHRYMEEFLVRFYNEWNGEA